MNAMFFSPHLPVSLPTIDLKGWGQTFVKTEPENVTKKDSMKAAAAPLSPSYEYKQQRLSSLLDRLTEQIQNNNQYANPNWLVFKPPAVPKEDAPLDLSKKPKKEVPHARVKGKDAFLCSTCGQTFAVHDRLIKHIASRHRNRTPHAHRQYECETCERRFARSDMLTRHARLHSGEKPYACPICGQVFSRSDHLATHQRTHTGEKPYHCPVCPYAACRRDMITRHMRTHTRKENSAN